MTEAHGSPELSAALLQDDCSARQEIQNATEELDRMVADGKQNYLSKQLAGLWHP